MSCRLLLSPGHVSSFMRRIYDVIYNYYPDGQSRNFYETDENFDAANYVRLPLYPRYGAPEFTYYRVRYELPITGYVHPYTRRHGEVIHYGQNDELPSFMHLEMNRREYFVECLGYYYFQYLHGVFTTGTDGEPLEYLGIVRTLAD